MNLQENYIEQPEILPIFQGFQEYIAANPESVLTQRERLVSLAGGCNYTDACFLRDWLFQNRSQFSGTGRLRTFEAYAIFRGVADMRRNQMLFGGEQTV